MTQVWFARWISLCVGFLSLSQEILLVRLIGFVHHSTPRALSFVLVFFLLGIAIGAHVGKQVCRARPNPISAMAVVLLFAGAFDATVPYITAPLVASDNDHILAIVIFVVAALKSVAFPVAHHLGSGEDMGRLGSSVSKVYFFNIVGATFGPLVTGFVLLQYIGLAHALLLIGLGTFALGLWCASRVWPRRAAAAAVVLVLAVPSMLVLKPGLVEDIAVVGASPGTVVAQVVENRSGIIHVIRNEEGGDSTFGGNLYDGRLNTDLRVNSNGVHRVYVLAGLHPSPRRVLVIGLSSGAWTAILSRMPGVEHIDAIEINPGYLEVIDRYAVVRGILHDPKITIHIDDGRRWLRRNPDANYDLIVMNTTWHWRAYSSNLLSIEFLREVKRHLLPGGLAMYNSTGSPDVFHTAAQIFSFVRKYDNFVYASDRDLLAGLSENRQRIWKHGLPGPAEFNPEAIADRRAINDMFEARRFETVAEVERIARRPLEVISDDNLLPEYKYGSIQFFLPGFR